jgi:hypothetical protein
MTFERAQQWLKQHDHVIPALEVNHKELIRLLGHEHQSHNLVDLAVRDPGIAFALLKRVNMNRGPNSGRDPVDSPQASFALIGDPAIRSMLRRFQIAEKTLDDPQQLFLFHQLANRALHNEFQAARWAESSGYQQLEPIKIAALLAYIGETLCCLYAFDTYLEYLHGELDAASQTRLFGFSFDELTRVVVRQFHLPELIRFALPSSGNREQRSQLLQLLTAIDLACEQGWNNETTNELLARLAQFLALPEDRVATRTHRFAVDAARETKIPDAWQPAARLVLCDDSPWSDSARQAAVAETAVESVKPDHPPEPSLHAAVRAIKALIKDPSTTQSKVLRRCVDTLHHDLAFSRVSLLLLNRQQDTLLSRMVAGIDDNAPLHDYQIQLAQAGLFKILLSKPQAVWINRHTFNKYQKYIPPSLIAAAMTNDFFAMSLFIGSKPVGVVYADRSGSSEHLSDESFNEFKQLILFSGKALTLVAKRQQSVKT